MRGFESISSYLRSFDTDVVGFAKQATFLAEKYSIDVFYRSLKMTIENEEDAECLFSELDFILSIFQITHYYPGSFGQSFKLLLLNKKEINEVIKMLFLKTKSHYIRTTILEYYFRSKDYFNDGIFDEILRIGIEKDQLLVPDVLSKSVGMACFDEFCKLIVKDRRRYLVWGLLQYFIDTLDPGIENYIGEINKIDDSIIKERIKYLNIKKEIYNGMLQTGIELTEAQEELLQHSIFDFHNFVIALVDFKTGEIKDDSESEKIILKMIALA